MEINTVKLSEVCEITSSKRIYANEYTENGIPFYRSKEIIEKSNNQELSDPLFISNNRYNEISAKFGSPKENDILLTSVGTLGIPYLVRKDDLFYFKDGNLTWMRNFNNKINSKYLYYWLRSDFGKMPLISRAIGSSQGAITIDILKKYPILLPDINHQNKIVNIISNYDELINEKSQLISLQEKEIERIYKHLFFNKNVSTKAVRLNEIIEIERGISYSSNEINTTEGINLINLGNIKPFGGFNKEGIKKYNGAYKESQIVKDGDLIMGVTDMTQDRRTVGSVAILNNLEGLNAISSDLILIKSDINNYYLFSMFKYGNVSKYISQLANGTNVLHLRPDSVLKTKINIPNKDLIEEYVFIVKDMFESNFILEKQISLLIDQRDKILPRLVSGKLKV